MRQKPPPPTLASASTAVSKRIQLPLIYYPATYGFRYFTGTRNRTVQFSSWPYHDDIVLALTRVNRARCQSTILRFIWEAHGRKDKLAVGNHSYSFSDFFFVNLRHKNRLSRGGTVSVTRSPHLIVYDED